MKIKAALLLKNATANVASGLAGALIAVFLPPVLAKSLDTDAYSVWALALQMGGYVMMLNLGISTAVGRYVAHTTELQDLEERNRVVSTSTAMLACLSLLGSLITIGFALNLGNLFPRVPSLLLPDARSAVLLIGLSNALVMSTSAFSGVFFGLQRNIVPAACVFSTRILLVPAVLISVLHGGSIVQIATLYATANVLQAGLQSVAFFKLDGIRLSFSAFSGRVAKEVGHYCAGLSVWTIAMLFVSGLDTTLVAWLDFRNVAAYAMVSGLINCIIGFQQALLQTLIPEGAKVNASAGPDSMGQLLLYSTRYSTALLAIVTLPLAVLARPLTEIWVGQAYSTQATPILQVLGIASMIRLLFYPYATLLIAAAQQRMALMTAMLEGVVNLAFSLILGKQFGATGVAVGTLIGALVGVAGHLLYNMPRTNAIRFKRSVFISNSIGLPIVSFIPATLILMFVWPLCGSAIARINLCVGCLLTWLITCYTFILSSPERQFVSQTIGRIPWIREKVRLL